MKTIIIFISFSFLTLFCQATFTQTNEIKARLIICSGLTEKNVPLDNLSEINIKEGDKVYFYTKWFNLNKTKHQTSVEILDAEDNYLAQSNEYVFKPRKKTHNTWNSRKFREVFIPDGLIKIRIILNEKIILERKINVKYIRK